MTKSKLDGFTDKLKQIDGFGEPFMFNLPNGRKTKKSFPGCCITIIAVNIVIFYAVIQFFRLINFGEPTIMVSERESYYDMDHEFTTSDGFMVAFGITAYDDNTEPIEEA